MGINSSKHLVTKTSDFEMRRRQSPISELKLKDIEDEDRENCKQSLKESVCISSPKDMGVAAEKRGGGTREEAVKKRDVVSSTEAAAQPRMGAVDLSECEIPYSDDPGAAIKNSRFNSKHNQNIE